jgi:uncharacterized protein YfaT (DUF1175 family)
MEEVDCRRASVCRLARPGGLVIFQHGERARLRIIVGELVTLRYGRPVAANIAAMKSAAAAPIPTP